jgi:uncharacterized membrane protein
MPAVTEDKRRLEAIDIARGIALVAMVIYHFTWDLEFFGYVEPGTAATGGWRLFARSIASSFLFLVGVSLVLAQGRTFRLAPFLKRLGMIVGAAALITIATYFATPANFIFFGILHQIALASVLGLAFLRLPVLAVIAAAIAIIALPNFLRADFFNNPALLWVGLSTQLPRSSDFVPLFPWFGVVLLGMAAARLARSGGIVERLRGRNFGRWSSPLQWIGRHSLGFYLVHQPVLIGLLFLVSQVFPAPAQDPSAAFSNACLAQCGEVNDEAFCQAYCGCVLAEIETAGRIDEVFAGGEREDTSQWLEQTAAACTMNALPEMEDLPG